MIARALIALCVLLYSNTFVFTYVITSCSYEELLLDSSDEEKEDRIRKSRRGKQQLRGKQQARSSGQAWIKESSGDEPVNFLDPSVIQQVVGTYAK